LKRKKYIFKVMMLEICENFCSLNLGKNYGIRIFCGFR
jgi:hypothetical protein